MSVPLSRWRSCLPIEHSDADIAHRLACDQIDALKDKAGIKVPPLSLMRSDDLDAQRLLAATTCGPPNALPVVSRTMAIMILDGRYRVDRGQASSLCPWHKAAFQREFSDWNAPIWLLCTMEGFGKDRLVAAPANGNGCLHVIVLRDIQLGTGAIRVEAANTMSVPSKLGRLKGQIGPGCTGIKRMAARRHYLAAARPSERLLRYGNQDHGRILGPALIPVGQ